MIWIVYLVNGGQNEELLGLVDAPSYANALVGAWSAWRITEPSMRRRVSARALQDADQLPAGLKRQARIAGMWAAAKLVGALVVGAPILGGKWSAAFIVGDWRAPLCHDLHTREDLALKCGRRRARKAGIMLKEARRG